ncbi:hypothetical protein GPECTOR_115g322 [Gonium pectorale]|uniref:FAST kinase leucine-rich domain-containing protein n=1 Tax=Gonium pectorale TaxID=33097 RepID=A0A150FZ16_GONPE|nr:hypothetical protein GPECTOR_115g322 [Gonium pectorale]|eukprot:KXZ42828.1 hypothetical protein GPECTOR_115g322 [Gonium pectorale]
MKVDLASQEPLGPYLAKELEDRALAVAQREGFKDPRHTEQLLYGLSNINWGWDKDALRTLISQTLHGMQSWEHGPKSVAQTCHCIQMFKLRHGVRLSEDQQAQMTAAVRTTIDTVDSDTLALSADSLLAAVDEMGLSLPPEAIKRLHDSALAMQRWPARKNLILALSNILFYTTKLGYQPTVSEAQLWSQRLLLDLSEQLTSHGALSWVLLALSACRSYSAPQELRARLQALAEGLPPNCKPGVASRTVIACSRWGVQLSPSVMRRLESRYKS